MRWKHPAVSAIIPGMRSVRNVELELRGGRRGRLAQRPARQAAEAVAGPATSPMSTRRRGAFYTITMPPST